MCCRRRWWLGALACAALPGASSDAPGAYGGAVGAAVAAGAGAGAGSLAEVVAECDFEGDGRRIPEARVSACVAAALRAIGPVDGLGSLVGSTNDTRAVCAASAEGARAARWGCEATWTLAWELLAKGLACVAICRAADGDSGHESHRGACQAAAVATLGYVRGRLEWEVALHSSSPMQELIGRKCAELLDKLLTTVGSSFSPALLWEQVVEVAQTLCERVRWYTWRENHFVWLMEVLSTGEVGRSLAWGTVDHWDTVGANDARAGHVLDVFGRPPPAYVLSEIYGMRWDILITLLRDLHRTLGAPAQLVVVEIGVFAAHLSRFVLDALPYVKLIGVDPYIGRDGTFPGDYSATLSPDVALQVATETFAQYGQDRALLLDVTSVEAAARVPLASVDVVFIDGCHLYECVVADLAAWVPRLRGPGSLVVGHDFSPQWPGVVRAVHEFRESGRKVNLGMDWTWWWLLD